MSTDTLQLEHMDQSWLRDLEAVITPDWDSWGAEDAASLIFGDSLAAGPTLGPSLHPETIEHGSEKQ